jgi:hypothetical protein
MKDPENGLSKVILSHLELAEESEDFRESFFAIIDGASKTCGDRMALSVLHLGIVSKLQSIDKSDLRGYANFLLRGPWMLEQLEQIAREKVKIQRFDDEIEVFLAYPVKLKERLNLPIDVDEMLYFDCSGVTEQDLDNAATSIEEMLKVPGAEENILAQRQELDRCLEKRPARQPGIASQT